MRIVLYPNCIYNELDSGSSDQGFKDWGHDTELMTDSSPTMYEDERARNIAENKALLAGLGLQGVDEEWR